MGDGGLVGEEEPYTKPQKVGKMNFAGQDGLDPGGVLYRDARRLEPQPERGNCQLDRCESGAEEYLIGSGEGRN